jgi:hypothetical protein
VRTTLASLDDIIRTTAAHSGKKASEQLPRLRRLLDLAQTVGPDPDKFPPERPAAPVQRLRRGDDCGERRVMSSLLPWPQRAAPP